MQHPRPIGPVTNIAAPFSPEMVAGTRPPDRSRDYSPVNKLGWSVSQTTHVAATFQPNMTIGWQPHANRYAKPFPQGTQWWTPEVPVFSIEMIQGSKPDQPRLFLGPRIPLPVSQTTHVAAPFSAEMVAGASPDRNRAFVYPKTGVTWWTPEVDPFSVEMVIGWHPDRPRVHLGPRIPLPTSQTTHTDAPFSAEMVAGVTAPTKRYAAPFHVGWQWWTPEVEAFSIEMVQGWHPDTARIRLGPKIPLPVAQPTHTAAPFSLEMTQGAAPPERSHAYEAKKVGWSVSQLTHTPAPFSFDMVTGSPGVRRAETWTTRRWGSFILPQDGVIITNPAAADVIVTVSAWASTVTVTAWPDTIIVPPIPTKVDPA